MIAGFILHNDNWIVVRGLGPSLTQFGVPDTLADPKIRIARPEWNALEGERQLEGRPDRQGRGARLRAE